MLNSSTGSMGTTGDTARIKYNSENTATAYYLRDPQIGTGTAATNAALKNRTRAVLTSGNITAGSCNITGSGQARYLAPCCCIV